MSYTVRLLDKDGAALPTEHFAEGGTRNLYGTNECDLNVTGNYWQVWRLIDWEPRELDAMLAEDTKDDLRKAFEALGGLLPNPPNPFKDYWAPTPGNALAVVVRLQRWAEEHPDGFWQVIG